MGVVSGEVRDASGALVAGNVVRAYRRDTGAFLGETLSSDGSGSGDPYFNETVLLIHGSGKHGSGAIIDESARANELTISGGAYQSEAKQLYGRNTIFFPSYDSYVSLPPGEDLNLGTGDFTIEAWGWFPNANKNFVIFSNTGPENNTGLVFIRSSNGTLRIRAPGAGFDISSTIAAPKEKFIYITLVRKGITFSAYLNGENILSGDGYVNLRSPHRNFIGFFENYDLWNMGGGYLGEIRITKAARYTENFVPPAEPHVDVNSSVEFGRYSMSLAYAGEVNLICLSNDEAVGEIRNDRILRTVA